ncbi:MAG: tetratricopeptide repeat protein [Candidatus Hermodarchaeota archaeon]
MSSGNQIFWSKAPQDVTLASLFEVKKKYSFLAGSGISLDPPSSLPTGYNFTKMILEQLVPAELKDVILTYTNPEREDMLSPGDFLRFEQIMEILYNTFDPNLNVLDVFGYCDKPNLNHLLLARLISQEHIVFTTNFDSLIEHALLALKADLSREDLFPVIYKDEWENTTHQKIPIYKLHGSILNIAQNKETRDSIQATLKQITREKSDTFQLEHWKTGILRNKLTKHDLIVIGYSGLDDFDVLPTIQAIPTQQTIFWINHDSDRTPQNPLIEVISKETAEKKDIGEIRDFKDRTGINLVDMVKNRIRGQTKIIRIHVHTQKFLQWLNTHLQTGEDDSIEDVSRFDDLTTLNSVESQESPLKVSLTSFDGLKLSKHQNWYFAGDIFNGLHRSEEALNCYQQALKLAKEEKDFTFYYQCYNNMGHILKNQGLLEKALAHYEEALKMSENIISQHGKVELIFKSHQLNNIGRIWADLGDYNKALSYYHQALEIWEQLNDLDGISSTFNNIAQISYFLGKTNEALNYYQQALKIDEQLGNLKGKMTKLNNIGIIFSDFGQVDKALQYYQQAFAIADQLNELTIKTSQLNNIGRINETKGRLDEALEYYKDAFTVAEHIGSSKAKTAILTNMGRIYGRQGKSEEAMNCHLQVLELAEELKDIKVKSISLNAIGLLLHDQGKLDEALEYYQKAFLIAEKLEDMRGKAQGLNNIGGIYLLKDEYEKALDSFKKALPITEQIRDIRGMHATMNNIASVFQKQGKYSKAIEYYQKVLAIDRQLRNPQEIALTLSYIGACTYKQGNIQQAIDIYKQALDIAYKIGNTGYIKTFENNIRKLTNELKDK